MLAIPKNAQITRQKAVCIYNGSVFAAVYWRDR